MGTLIKLFVVGIAGIVAVSIVLSLIGAAISLTFGLVGFLLFKVAPLLLVGYVVLRLVNRNKERQRLSPADQKWLDGA